MLEHRRVAEFLDRSAGADAPDHPGPSLDGTLAALAALGLPPGSAVLLALSNSLHMLRLYLSALLLGLVPLAVAPATPSSRIRGLARRLEARALIAARPDPRRYGAPGVHPVPGGAAVLLGEGGGPSPYRAGDVLMSTSGTSGAFSACLHRASSLLRNAERHARAVGMNAGDTVLVSLPLYYSYAMVAQVLAAYGCGARVVVAGPPFSPAGYLKQIADHGVTHSSITPAIVRRLLAEPMTTPSAVRVLTVGGDRVPPDHVARLLADRPGGELYLTYGLTEAGPRVSTLAAHAEPPGRYASVGLPLPGARVWLREQPDDDGTGELMVATDTALVRKISDAPSARRTLAAPGVVATGDVFHIDDGYLYYRGRLSDFVMIRGEKVCLSSVRQAAQALPGVVRCVTKVRVGDDGDSFLEVEVAVTDPRPDAAQRIRRALNSFLLPGERPRTVTVTMADPQVFHK
ncbi:MULTISPECIES: class I adenylate-forming enzyme family protein [unclassified Streptomyces]|uniref:class I adenylate-forming enzyme family protein n=1 Tax=unclassified Streptomyces TaxID=2593676 RepID=UPI003830872A